MKRNTAIHRFAQRTLLQGELIPTRPLLELCGFERMLIENHQGIMEYGHERIRIRVKNGLICVSGKQLQLCMMSASRLVIAGIVEEIKLDRG